MCKQQKGGTVHPAMEGHTWMCWSKALRHTGRTELQWQQDAIQGQLDSAHPGDLDRRKSAGRGRPGGDPCVWEGGGQRMSHGKRPGVAGGLISQANRPLARRSRWAFGGDLEGPSQSKLALEWWRWLAGGGVGGWGLGGGGLLTRVSELEILSVNKTNNATGVERLAKMNLNGSATLSLVRRQSSHQMKYLGHPVNSHMAQPSPRSPTPTWSDAGLCF